MNPVGTGPYLLTDFNDYEVRFKKNPTWWGEGVDYFKDRNNFDTIIYKIISDNTAALAAHKNGEIDTLSLDPKQWMRETGTAKFKEKYEKYLYFPKYGTGYSYIGYNADPAKNLPFADKRVRQALSMMVDREHMLKNIYFTTLGRSVSCPFSPDEPRSPKGLTPPPFDPTAALALLGEAGWKDTDGDGLLDKNGKPFQFQLIYNEGNDQRKAVAENFQDELKTHGITLNIQVLEWTTFLEKVNNHEYEAIILGWGSAIDSDPYQIWHSSQIKQGDNFAHFSNARVDELLQTARVTMDREKRNELYREFCSIVAEEQPYTFLFTQPALQSVSRRFGNVRVFPLGMASDLWFLPESEQTQ
jgi:peptide/nickel transport system substrate-binding protein